MPADGILAGKLRHYVAVERNVKTSSGDRGQPVSNWVAVCSNVPAWIQPRSGSQREVTHQLTGVATHSITMRYRPGVLPGMRVTYQGRIFAIGWAGTGDERKHWLTLDVTEQVTGASA